MMKKEEYRAPEIEIVYFYDADIIRTSSPDTTTPKQPITSGFNLY